MVRSLLKSVKRRRRLSVAFSPKQHAVASRGGTLQARAAPIVILYMCTHRPRNLTPHTRFESQYRIARSRCC